MRVIVAGGGLAGLTVARALAKARVSATIVEARDRLGGRVWTVPLAAGQHGELGGEFIDADQDEIRELCDELQVPLVRVLRSGFTHRFRGDDGDYHVSRTRPWAELESLVTPLLRRFKAAGGKPDSAAVREIATWSLRAWLREREASRAQHAMADALRGFFLADPDELSVLPLVEQLAEGGSPAQAEMYRVEGGNERLVQAMVRETDAHVLLQHRITAVAQASDRVMITAVDAQGHQQQLAADAAVVTLPASILSEIAFTPALPDEQWRAIRALRYGCATKVVVQSRCDPFRGKARAFATDTALGAFWDGTEGQLPTPNAQVPNPKSQPRIPKSQPPDFVLTFLAGGSSSGRLKARVARGAQAVLSDLCWLGMAGAPVDAMQAHTWEDDPFARGGYAYLDPGFDPAWRAQLSRRAGRLVFAGEHTSEEWQGYMNGAVESGLRAAHELLSGRGA
jgi:monoamine oxidase